jgi:hypothetical protein
VLLTPIGNCPWDVNGDGVVDQFDVDQMSWSNGCSPSRICVEDVNGDCHFNENDIKLVLLHFGTCQDTELSLSESVATVWLEGGGYNGLRTGQITGEHVEDALVQPTEAERAAAMFILLSN